MRVRRVPRSGPAPPVRLMLAAVAVSACTIAPTPATTATTLPPDPMVSVEVFAACMRETGVPLPEPISTALAPLFADVDPTSPELAAGLERCVPVLAAGGILDSSGDPGIDAAVARRLGVFAACVRSRGVEDFPEPDGVAFPPVLVPRGDPAFEAALVACSPPLGGP